MIIIIRIIEIIIMMIMIIMIIIILKKGVPRSPVVRANVCDRKKSVCDRKV